MARTASRALGAALTIALFLASHARTAIAAWLPSTPGNTWVYQGDQGGHQVERITGTTTLHHRTVFVKHYYEGADAGLENYWLHGINDSVLLAGFYAPSAGFGYIYEPPIRFLTGPPSLGDQPFWGVMCHDFATDAPLFLSWVRYDVLEYGDLTVPAGVFPAYGVGNIPFPGDAADEAGLTLDGRVMAPRAKTTAIPEPTDWFSENVGVVQYRAGAQLYQLVSSQVTAASRSTWAAIKRLYR